MIYDRFVRVLLPLIPAGQPGVRVQVTGRMVRLRIGGEICLRFKRLDNRLRSGNVRTRNQREIYHQRALIDVDDGATSVTFGYVPNKLGDGVRGVYVTCPKNWRENEWMIALRDASEGGIPLFNPSPMPPQLPLPSILPAAKPGATRA